MARGHRWVWVCVVMMAIALPAAACGGGSTASSGGSYAPAPSTATETGSLPLGAASTPAANELNEIATDNKFSLNNFTLKAGQSYTLILTNKGQAAHNWRVNDAQGPDGKDIAAALIDGNKSSKVVFAISKPGTYHFVCDVHPDDMKGTFAVQ